MTWVGRLWRRAGLQTILVSPLVLYILGFTLLPVLTSIYLGLQDPDTLRFPSLVNYAYIVGHNQFRDALFNTVAIALISLALELAVGLALTLLLRQAFRGKGFFRALLMVPMGVPTLVSGATMAYVFNTTGYLNEILYRLGIIEIPIDWAAGGFRTIMMIVVADMWKVTPLVVLLLLAGLESIPEEVYEAAAIDGARRWQTFRYVTLPLLKPAITMTLIIRAIDAFRIFELPLVLAGRTTPVLATYAYTEYNAYLNPYTSGAASTILLLLILAFILAYMRLVEGKGGVER